MTISVVNSFLCFSSCDVAKAMKGENPHPRADAITKPAEKSPEASRIDEPAVVLGGALKMPGTNGVALTGAGQSINPTIVSNQNTATDILA
jgi:hypothetical protein